MAEISNIIFYNMKNLQQYIVCTSFMYDRHSFCFPANKKINEGEWIVSKKSHAHTHARLFLLSFFLTTCIHIRLPICLLSLSIFHSSSMTLLVSPRRQSAVRWRPMSWCTTLQSMKLRVTKQYRNPAQGSLPLIKSTNNQWS